MRGGRAGGGGGGGEGVGTGASEGDGGSEGYFARKESCRETARARESRFAVAVTRGRPPRGGISFPAPAATTRPRPRPHRTCPRPRGPGVTDVRGGAVPRGVEGGCSQAGRRSTTSRGSGGFVGRRGTRPGRTAGAGSGGVSHSQQTPPPTSPRGPRLSDPLSHSPLSSLPFRSLNPLPPGEEDTRLRGHYAGGLAGRPRDPVGEGPSAGHGLDANLSPSGPSSLRACPAIPLAHRPGRGTTIVCPFSTRTSHPRPPRRWSLQDLLKSQGPHPFPSPPPSTGRRKVTTEDPTDKGLWELSVQVSFPHSRLPSLSLFPISFSVCPSWTFSVSGSLRPLGLSVYVSGSFCLST